MAKVATVRQLQCASLLMAQGYMPSGASALTGNFTQESGVNLPTAFRTGKLDHGSQGLAQWRLGRLDAYQAFVAAKHPDLDEDNLWNFYGRFDYQVEFVAKEMREDYPKLDAALRKGGSVSSLTAMVCWQYERPSKAYANLANRISNALLVFNSIPQGAKAANKTEIVAAIDAQADKHNGQAAAGAGAAIAATGLGGAVGLAHVANDIAWWEWGVLGLAFFIIICGVTSMIQQLGAATLVRNAKPKVDPDLAKHVPQLPDEGADIRQEPIVDSDEGAREQRDYRRRVLAQASKADEQKAIDDAMVRTQHGPVTVAAPPPVMQIIKPEQSS